MPAAIDDYLDERGCGSIPVRVCFSGDPMDFVRRLGVVVDREIFGMKPRSFSLARASWSPESGLFGVQLDVDVTKEGMRDKIFIIDPTSGKTENFTVLKSDPFDDVEFEIEEPVNANA